MNTLRYLLAALLTMALQPCSALAQNGVPAQKNEPSGAVFNFIHKGRIHDFGTMLLNGSGEYQFEFVNSGTAPLVIKEMHGTGKGLNMPASWLPPAASGALCPSQIWCQKSWQ